MSLVIGIACEDEGHFTAVTHLVDAAAIQAHDWLDGILDHCRAWRGGEEGQPWYKYDKEDAHSLRPAVIEGRRISIHGHIDGQPQKPEAGMWRRILLHFHHSRPRPDIVVLVRDLDGYPERREGMEQVRPLFRGVFPVVLATPQPEVEAWSVCGFVPCTPEERSRLAELAGALSFDPTLDSHRLTSHPNDADTDSKRVLKALCREDRDRILACYADRQLLAQRGIANGLASFLEEVDELILPRFVR